MTMIVGVEMTLVGLVGADAVTDLIEVLTDALDEAGFVPSVSASGSGPVRLKVEVVTESGELPGLEAGIAAISKALQHAGVEHAIDVQPFVGQLAPA